MDVRLTVRLVPLNGRVSSPGGKCVNPASNLVVLEQRLGALGVMKLWHGSVSELLARVPGCSETTCFIFLQAVYMDRAVVPSGTASEDHPTQRAKQSMAPPLGSHSEDHAASAPADPSRQSDGSLMRGLLMGSPDDAAAQTLRAPSIAAAEEEDADYVTREGGEAAAAGNVSDLPAGAYPRPLTGRDKGDEAGDGVDSFEEEEEQGQEEVSPDGISMGDPLGLEGSETVSGGGGGGGSDGNLSGGFQHGGGTGGGPSGDGRLRRTEWQAWLAPFKQMQLQPVQVGNGWGGE